MRIEEDLGIKYGFSPSEVRQHIQAAYKSWNGSAPTIADCAGLVTTILSINQRLLADFQSNPQNWIFAHRKRPLDKSAIEFAFAIGILIADPCKRTAFPLSYIAACSIFQKVSS
jgi:hypothetical protein